MRGFQIGVWRTLGSNALAGYVVHGVACWGFLSLLPRKAPLGTVLPALLLYLVICYACVRVLEWKRIYWRTWGCAPNLVLRAAVQTLPTITGIRLVNSTRLAKDGGRASEL